MNSSIRMTIAIPTYNRAPKVGRAVRIFAREILESHLENAVEILVSDNASPDNTGEILRDLIREFPKVMIRYQRHPINLGFGGNLFSCFQAARGSYVWFFADDDIPFSRSLLRIVETLNEHSPSALLFSFTQPPGSTVRTFNFPEPVHLERNASASVKLMLQYMKVSIYVLRRAPLDASVVMRLEELLKTAPNYGWGGLGIEIISMYPESPVAIISEPLAGCDDEFVSVLNWVPLEWQNECAVFDHPYIKANAPEVYRDRERWTYRMALSFFWGWRAGTLGISERMASQWWESLGRLPIKWRWLVPGIMAPLMILSLKIWPKRLPKLITDTKRWAMGPRKS